LRKETRQNPKPPFSKRKGGGSQRIRFAPGLLFEASIQAIAFAPAAGFRWQETGTMASVGAEGDAWSSSPCNADSPAASYMAFCLEDWVEPFRTAGRALGFPVRCVQHLRLLSSRLKRKGVRSPVPDKPQSSPDKCAEPFLAAKTRFKIVGAPIYDMIIYLRQLYL